MAEQFEIENAIADVTGLASGAAETGETVWIYGQVLWTTHPLFRFVACRGRETREVKLMADQVTRYRDNESAFFLIELSRTMATALGLDGMILTAEELARLKRNIDTSRPW